MEGGGDKNCLKLRDVIFGRPVTKSSFFTLTESEGLFQALHVWHRPPPWPSWLLRAYLAASKILMV